MVNAATAIDAGSTNSSLYTRGATVVSVLSTDEAGTVAIPANDAKPANLANSLRYNSFEFSYRQDFGKIVLLRQEPETGEVVQQFPSEYYLQKYAQSERAVRSQARSNESGNGGSVPDAPANQSVSSGSSGAGNSDAGVIVAASPSPAPSSAPAPSLPSGGVSSTSSTGAGRVDITV